MKSTEKTVGGLYKVEDTNSTNLEVLLNVLEGLEIECDKFCSEIPDIGITEESDDDGDVSND